MLTFFIFLDLFSFQKIEVPSAALKPNEVAVVTFFRPKCESCKKQLIENKGLGSIPIYAVGMGGSRAELQKAVKDLNLNYSVTEATAKALESLKITQEVTPVTFLVFHHKGQWSWVKNPGFIEKNQLMERTRLVRAQAKLDY